VPNATNPDVILKKMSFEQLLGYEPPIFARAKLAYI
jgi:hypothetical protein